MDCSVLLARKAGGLDRDGYQTYGTAHVVRTAVWLSADEAPTDVIQSALHEAWHMAEEDSRLPR